MTTQSDLMPTDDHLGSYDDRDEAPEDVTGIDDALDESYDPDLRDADAAGDAPPDSGMSRRTLLRSGAAAGALVVGAGSQLWLPAESAEAHGTIRSYSGIWGQRTRYEANGNYASFGYRPSFHDRMSHWLYYWNNHTPYRRSIVVWTYGVHTDHRVSEAHNAGRGFDLTRIYATGSDGNRHLRAFLRHDIWKNYGDADRRRHRRWYWGTSAICHHHFRNVLTYYYNSAHDNHIHIDNLVSGTSNSNFATGSKAQVQHVQACCRWVWGKSTAIDGVWGPQTRQHSHDVLVRIGKGGYLTSSKSHWLAFNTATCRKAYGVQSY